MKRTAGQRMLARVGTVVLVLTGSDARADDGALPTGGASGGPYRIDAMTVDGGGGRSANSAYVVNGTAGQHDADPLQPSSGGSFSVTGGLWPAATLAAGSDRLFADGFESPVADPSGSIQAAN